MKSVIFKTASGSSLVIEKSVADDLGYSRGKTLSDAETLEAIAANAVAGFATIARMREPS